MTDHHHDPAVAGVAVGLKFALNHLRTAGVLGPEPHLDAYAWSRAAEMFRADVPFAALIAAALCRADTDNAALIRATWPVLAARTQRAYDTGTPNREDER